MTIKKTLDQGKICLSLADRLDSITAPQLECELDALQEGVKELTIDLKELSYMSSAGLRLMLKAHKKMTVQGGSMKVIGANAIIAEVFEITGFSDVLTIE